MSNSLNTQFSQLLVKPRGKNKPVCQVFISSPNPEEEKKIGKLFGIIEIDYYNKRNPEIIESIFAEIENSYYPEENNVLSPDLETYFENILQEVNQKLIDLIQNEEIFLNPKKLNAIIGVLRGRDLYFTQAGQSHAYLIHRRDGGHKMMNILANQTPKDKNTEDNDEASEVKRLKIFSNIVSGKINPGNILFFCTESVLDYISLDKIKKTISVLPPISASEHLKNMLSEATNEINFSGIIIRLIYKEAAQKDKTDFLSSKQSINSLLSTEEETKKVLTPSLKDGLKKGYSVFVKIAVVFINKGLNIFGKQKNKISAISKHSPILENIQNKISLNKQKMLQNNLSGQVIRFLKKLFSIIIHLLKFIFYLILLGIQLITRGSKSKEQKTLLPREKITKGINKGLDWFNKLNKTRKTLLIIGIILILFFVQSLVFLGKKQEREKEKQFYQQTLEGIQVKQDAAEASLIYNDEEKAQKLLFEAKSDLEKLPQNSKARREKFKSLSQEIENLIEKTKRIIKIAEPTEITNFLDFDPEIKIKGIIELDNNIYAHNSNQNLIYKLNLANQQVVTLDATATKLGQVQSIVLEDKKSLLFYDDKRTLVRFKLDTSVLKVIDINFVRTNPEIKDINFYNNRLYILDTKNNQIYRHQKTETGFGKGTAWVKEPNTELINATSLTIDGSIYILKTNGQIWEFKGGYKQDFSIKSIIDPALSNPNKIFTDFGLDYLYILDPENKRLVVINKETGRLKAQYWSDKFDNLKDFIVRKDNKKIYLLNGARIFVLEAEHLKT